MIAGAATPLPAARADAITIRTNVPFGQAGGVTLLLDEYLPGTAGLFPAVLAIHGGGWWSGDKKDWANNCRTLALQGFACFSVNYRLAPQFPYPAAVDDVAAAVRWVRDHAGDLHVDPTRLGAIGSSAGGHLAAMLGASGSGSTLVGSRVNVVVAWSGAFDFTMFPQQAPNESTQHIDDFLGCDVRAASCHATASAASPVTHLDASDPPMLIASSSRELVPVAQPEEMANDLKRLGIPYRLTIVPGNHHGTALRDQVVPGSRQTVLQASVSFLDRWIGAVRSLPSASAPDLAEPPSGHAEPSSWWIGAGALVIWAVALAVVGSAVRRRRRARHQPGKHVARDVSAREDHPHP